MTSVCFAGITGWTALPIVKASDDKADVPSGTSRELAETLAQVKQPRVTVPLADLHGPVEARGADVEGTRVHSVRLPSFVATTEVVFGGPGERTTGAGPAALPGVRPQTYRSVANCSTLSCKGFRRWATGHARRAVP